MAVIVLLLWTGWPCLLYSEYWIPLWDKAAGEWHGTPIPIWSRSWRVQQYIQIHPQPHLHAMLRSELYLLYTHYKVSWVQLCQFWLKNWRKYYVLVLVHTDPSQVSILVYTKVMLYIHDIPLQQSTHSRITLRWPQPHVTFMIHHTVHDHTGSINNFHPHMQFLSIQASRQMT
jgi:hypothetical protein